MGVLLLAAIGVIFKMKSKHYQLDARLNKTLETIKMTDEVVARDLEQASSSAQKKFEKQFFEQKDKARDLENKYGKLQDQLRKKESESEFLRNYCETIEKDIQGNYATSERYLIKRFYDLLADPSYQDITIYHSLGYIDSSGQQKEIDFLLITKKGILILEAKHWKGVTYIYCDNNGEKNVGSETDLLANTQYASFAKQDIKIFKEGCSMRVFVVKENDAKGTLVIRDYNNPISQVRTYSSGVYYALGKRTTTSAVVFHKDEQCQVVFNNKMLEGYQDIDGLTSIVVDDSIAMYLDKLGGNLTSEDMRELTEIVEQKFTYHYKMDKSNYTDQKFRVFAGDIHFN